MARSASPLPEGKKTMRPPLSMAAPATTEDYGHRPDLSVADGFGGLARS
jgi:hypothetical protein